MPTEMTMRDHFAAAAMTGLLASGDYGMEATLGLAWGMADAMLLERERKNHDAVPEARADSTHERPPNVRCQQAGESRCAASGSGSGTGKQPAPPCVETDGLPPDSRTGPINRTPECESPRRECGESLRRDVTHPDTKGRAAGGPAHNTQEPVAWADLWGVLQDARAEIASLREAIRRLAEQDATLSVQGGNVIVEMDETLTDAERTVLEVCANHWLTAPAHAVLCGLLKRMR